MKSILTTQAGQIQNLSGVVTVNIMGNDKQIAEGESVPAGAKLLIAENSAVEILYDDGTLLSSTTEVPSSNTAANADISDDELALSEIEEIQALILAGEDPSEGPDTAAGNQSNSEGGSSHVSISRSGNETLASNGFDTSFLKNDIANDENNNFSNANTTVLDSPSTLNNDSNIIPEDTVASGNVLSNDTDFDEALSVVSFEVEGQTYNAGTSVELDDGVLVINADGSYTFTPNENWNGVVPVITYTTNTGLTATLTIEVTPVDDTSVLVNDSNTIAEDEVATGNVLD
ncbi:retention module-containing protein, partial [Shewanella sp. 10N.261.52.F9]|uniref:retention module-containing protein n=1 Tax=Shewanella sp. 10N.261.52.F9 TaxID=3229684 RepID=UPI00354B9045